MKKLRTACYEEVILSSNILTAKVYDDKAQWLAKEEAELVKETLNKPQAGCSLW